MISTDTLNGQTVAYIVNICYLSFFSYSSSDYETKFEFELSDTDFKESGTEKNIPHSIKKQPE